jgi:hypothetical protein
MSGKWAFLISVAWFGAALGPCLLDLSTGEIDFKRAFVVTVLGPFVCLMTWLWRRCRHA